MANPRLPFLWPFLFNSVTPTAVQRTAPRRVRRYLQAGQSRHQGTVTQRYGTANEPFPGPRDPSNVDSRDGTVIDVKALSRTSAGPGAKSSKRNKGTQSKESRFATADKTLTESAAKTQEPGRQERQQTQSAERRSTQGDDAADPPPPDVTSAYLSIPRTEGGKSDSKGLLSESSIHQPSRENIDKSAEPDGSGKSSPSATVVNAPSTSESMEMATIPGRINANTLQSDDHRAPHMNTPPYVHHFDTYSLVQRLESGGWTRDQSVTIMKAVRQALFSNMTLATEALVSKSNVENETYLFRAACSELKTEISTKRKSEQEKSGTQRTQLQHEVDILSQKLDQQGSWLKDELKGMFDDRKMAVRNEQRAMESKIQQLNYRITVALNSDSRSDVEGVRWIITKRAIAALVICVCMVLSSLKYSSVTAQALEEERSRIADVHRQHHHHHVASSAASSGAGGGPGTGTSGRAGAGGSDVASGESGQSEGRIRDDGRGERRMYVEEVLVKDGDNPSFVSLG